MRRIALHMAASCAVLLAACGGDDDGPSTTPSPAPTATPTPPPTPTPSPTPTPTSSAQCSLSARQDWARAALQEWYLFPELLGTDVNPAAHATAQSYIDALVAPARDQNRDRYFTHLTSIAEEDAYFQQGLSGGFGFRLGYHQIERRLFVIETFERTPASDHNVDRGTEILAIGTSSANLQPVATLVASGGPAALMQAMGSEQPGVARVLRIRDQAGIEREMLLVKRTFALQPVSEIYGTRIFEDEGRKIGYINLRSFIDPAEPALRSAFAQFKAQGVSELIVDLRYNGGGLLSIASLLGSLMAADRAGQPFSHVTFRPSKAEGDYMYPFEELPEAIAPTRVAFIGADGTASASEVVINAFVPILGDNMALIGFNTYGKPVGQIAIDRPECDDRLRPVALKIENSARQSDYYNGLASTVANTCLAFDELAYPLGDPGESMVRTALDFLAGRACAPIPGIGAMRTMAAPPARELLVPEQPTSTRERELPGVF